MLVTRNVPSGKCSVKRLMGEGNQVRSGVFVDSAYVAKGKEQVCQRKGVVEAQKKYYGGGQIDREIKQQFDIKRSRSAYFKGEKT